MLPRFQQREELRHALHATMWGATASWESTAWEQGYAGSLRANVCGTRIVFCTDGLMLLKFMRQSSTDAGSSALAQNISVEAMRKFFRDLSKEFLMRITTSKCFSYLSFVPE